MSLILDFQGFKRPNNTFVLKELAAIRIDYYAASILNQFGRGYFIFKPPMAWGSLSKQYQQINWWCERNQHGIPWEAGDFSYDDIKHVFRLILKNVKYIFVKGVEKKQWLHGFIGFSIPIIDLADIDCPPLRTLSASIGTACSHYHSRARCYNCAEVNVEKLRGWFIHRYGSGPSTEVSTMLYYQIQDFSKMANEDIKYLTNDFILQFTWKCSNQTSTKLPAEVQKQEKLKRKIKWSY